MEKRLRTLATISTRHFSAHLDQVLLRNGKLTERMRIQHPLAAAVVPFVDDHHIVMVKQYRYAIGQETLEIPAGKLDPGETAEICARRELLEETGYEATDIRRIFEYYPAIGYSDEAIEIYEARRLTKMTNAVDENEISRVEVLSMDEVREQIAKEKIRDGKTILALCILSGYFNGKPK